jgi:hypothetical protein
MHIVQQEQKQKAITEHEENCIIRLFTTYKNKQCVSNHQILQNENTAANCIIREWSINPRRCWIVFVKKIGTGRYPNSYPVCKTIASRNNVLTW